MDGLSRLEARWFHFRGSSTFRLDETGRNTYRDGYAILSNDTTRRGGVLTLRLKQIEGNTNQLMVASGAGPSGGNHPRWMVPASDQ
jgi:hypothetical protein